MGEEEGTDKASLGYLDIYEVLWSPIRHKQLTLLEIGAYYGGSLRTWTRFFPTAEIYCIEIGNYCPTNIGRATLLIGNQHDASFLHSVGKEHGPFDIVIDDGSHIWSDQQIAFDTLWEYVSKDGMYIIEDLGTSQIQQYTGNAKETTVEWLKPKLDLVIFDEYQSIKSLEFYRNLAIIHKRDESTLQARVSIK